MARRINIKGLYYAERTVESLNGTVTYGSPVRIPKLVSITSSDTVSSYTFYSDGGTEEAASKIIKTEGEIELGYLDNSLISKLLGRETDKNGLTLKNTNDKAANCALLVEFEKSNGESDFVVYYNCTLTMEESPEGKTMEEDVEGALYKLKFVAVPNPDGNISGEASTDGTTPVTRENFFKKVIQAGDTVAGQ